MYTPELVPGRRAKKGLLHVYPEAGSWAQGPALSASVYFIHGSRSHLSGNGISSYLSLVHLRSQRSFGKK